MAVMKAGKTLALTLIAAAGIASALAGCTKEDVKTKYSRQEQNIESFVKSIKSKVDTSYAVYQNGVTRLVTTYGVGTDSLSSHGTVSFYYAGYVLNNASLNTGDMFATNSKDIAAAAGWNLTDESVFEVKTLKLDDKDIVPGLRRGLAGVKEGQECFILFSGKYGFGKHELGTIPANAALAYHIKVESISN